MKHEPLLQNDTAESQNREYKRMLNNRFDSQMNNVTENVTENTPELIQRIGPDKGGHWQVVGK